MRPRTTCAAQTAPGRPVRLRRPPRHQHRPGRPAPAHRAAAAVLADLGAGASAHSADSGPHAAEGPRERPGKRGAGNCAINHNGAVPGGRPSPTTALPPSRHPLPIAPDRRRVPVGLQAAFELLHVLHCASGPHLRGLPCGLRRQGARLVEFAEAEPGGGEDDPAEQPAAGIGRRPQLERALGCVARRPGTAADPGGSARTRRRAAPRRRTRPSTAPRSPGRAASSARSARTSAAVHARTSPRTACARASDACSSA